VCSPAVFVAPREALPLASCSLHPAARMRTWLPDWAQGHAGPAQHSTAQHSTEWQGKAHHSSARIYMPVRSIAHCDRLARCDCSVILHNPSPPPL
jgi:hypothetical protein